jgi:hypothetical protein
MRLREPEEQQVLGGQAEQWVLQVLGEPVVLQALQVLAGLPELLHRAFR